ncbi:MAG: phosphonoacetaldehyde hydrolase [Pseudomonadota bacterium]
MPEKPIKAVVFDWAGTMIDFGSVAPVKAFAETFRSFGIEVSDAEARAPMGLTKRDHIAAMLSDPRIADAWTDTHGAPAGEADIDRMFARFVPINADVVAQHAQLVPGAHDMLRWLADEGIKVGSTTGYTREIMARVLPLAGAQGYVPANLVCSGDVPEGRPSPLGMYQCFVDLAVYPPSAVVKVDDTAPGIAEGIAAGCLTVGVAMSGNEVGLTVEELNALPADERDRLRTRAADVLRKAGADHVIDTVADLPDLLNSLKSDNPA